MAHGPVSETRVLLDGFGVGESPRWHEGRLWFSNWGTNEIVAVDSDGSLSNRRVWADVTGDGICIDAEGAGWCSAVGADGNVVLRVGEGCQVLDRIEVDRPCYACMLAGEDGKTLFMVVAQSFGPTGWTSSSRRRPVRSSPPG